MKALLCTLACTIVLSATAQGALFTYSAVLSGAAENPPVASAGTGSSLVTYNDVLHTLRVQITFSGLTGNTTASHIHCCTTPNLNAGVATQTPSFSGFPLGVTAGTYDNTFDLALASSWNAAYITANGGSPAGAEAALAAGLASFRAYVNVHSSFAGGGEIRGQLTPEPATGLLTGLAMAGLWVVRRRYRRG